MNILKYSRSVLHTFLGDKRHTAGWGVGGGGWGVIKRFDCIMICTHIIFVVL